MALSETYVTEQGRKTHGNPFKNVELNDFIYGYIFQVNLLSN